jgi:hypothetical protein
VILETREWGVECGLCAVCVLCAEGEVCVVGQQVQLAQRVYAVWIGHSIWSATRGCCVSVTQHTEQRSSVWSAESGGCVLYGCDVQQFVVCVCRLRRRRSACIVQCSAVR